MSFENIKQSKIKDEKNQENFLNTLSKLELIYEPCYTSKNKKSQK